MFHMHALACRKFSGKIATFGSLAVVNSNRLRSLSVLGIESSCDDTACAVVDHKKNVLGESLFNQNKLHREFGGIIPTIARDLHVLNIQRAVDEALEKSARTIKDVDAVAVTVKPGLPLSLLVGLNYAKMLTSQYGKHLIPIHHMEAHALTIRLVESVDFPYLVILMSGGHCLLAVVESVTQYKLLGTHIDISPGDLLDKTARRLRLKTLPELENLCGGASVEYMARNGDPSRFKFPNVMTKARNCNFSFSGLQFAAQKIIELEEAERGVGSSSVVSTVSDICASLQLAVLTHMAKQVYRAFLFCESKSLLPVHNRTMVLSGGVASNRFFRQGLVNVANEFDCKVLSPPAKLCTDNGVMIAWNGIEKMQLGLDLHMETNNLKVEHRSQLGESMINAVEKMGFKTPNISKLLAV